MHDRVFSRELGDLGRQAFTTSVTADLITSFGRARQHRFEGGDLGDEDGVNTSNHESTIAHRAGVKSLAIDKFRGKL
jgi:hypothetical protein